jgi:hypothetical protein
MGHDPGRDSFFVMEPKDPKEVYASYWEKLAALHSAEVCERADVTYLMDRGGYRLPVLNTPYLVIPDRREVLRMGPDKTLEREPLSLDFHLLVLYYLTESKKIEPARRWVSEKDLKGGEMFFRGPHALQLQDIEAKYGSDPEGFARAGKRLGGVEMLYGDRAFGLDVLPRILLVYVLWHGDQEFSPRIRVLFDETIQKHFPLDVIWCAVSEVNRRLIDLDTGQGRGSDPT